MAAPKIRVMFFCLGNICRSPLAEGIFLHHLAERELEHHFDVESSGTSAYHVGDAPDPGSQKVVRERLGIDISHQRSQQLTRNHVDHFDYLVAMDSHNYRDAGKLGGTPNLVLLRDYDREGQGEGVPDPWGGGGSHFERVFDIVFRSTEAFLDDLVERHNLF